MRISACLIVKNEQPFLDGCLLSLRGLVDEVVVVDTGSTDRTMDIVRAHGARLIEWAWRDDFAAARNVGLDAATGDWILYIDADERLTAPSYAQMREGLDPADVFAARVLFRPRSNATLCREYRLFRNDPRLRFKGSMHETIRPDLDRLRQDIGARVIDTAAMLTHLGYDGDMSDKYRRNLPLLRAALEANPDRLYYWNDLALTLAGLGEADEAVAIARQGLSRGQSRTEPGARVMRAALIQTLAGLLLQRGEDARQLIDEGLGLHPGNWSLLFLQARALVNAGAHDQALSVIDRLTAQDGETLCDETLSHDKRIFGCYAHDLAGLAWLRSGDRRRAAEAYARAAALAPDDPSYRVKALAIGAAAA